MNTFKSERIGVSGVWRISTNDANDDRVATCWTEENAKLVMDALNRPLHDKCYLNSVVDIFLTECTVENSDGMVLLRNPSAESGDAWRATLLIERAEQLAAMLLNAAREARGDTP